VTGVYDVLVCDPPWSYGTQARGSARKHYETIGGRFGAGVEAIADVARIGEWSAANAHLYLWVTNPKLPYAFALLAVWGFDYKTLLTWEKTTSDGAILRSGMGFYFRGATEHIIFAVKGDKGIAPALREPNIIRAQRGEHSEKPEAFYALVERVSAPTDRKLDVFARTRRDGWDSFGDQVDPMYQPRLFGATA
jgi:N6-adenosine-specific RNA methylase IME4